MALGSKAEMHTNTWSTAVSSSNTQSTQNTHEHDRICFEAIWPPPPELKTIKLQFNNNYIAGVIFVS